MCAQKYRKRNMIILMYKTKTLSSLWNKHMSCTDQTFSNRNMESKLFKTHNILKSNSFLLTANNVALI